jgi:Arc/MetJ-type ribon-helix-helix transcriptional regulator
MGTLNVKIPDEMEKDIEAFLERNPHYLNKSALVRDALRHAIESDSAGRRWSPGEDDPIFSAPTVTVEEPVDEGDIDDVVYGDADG